MALRPEQRPEQHPEVLRQPSPFDYRGYPEAVKRSFAEESDEIVIERVIAYLAGAGEVAVKSISTYLQGSGVVVTVDFERNISLIIDWAGPEKKSDEYPQYGLGYHSPIGPADIQNRRARKLGQALGIPCAITGSHLLAPRTNLV